MVTEHWTNLRLRGRRLYRVIAPWVQLLCCLAVIACSVGVYVDTKTNHAQDRQHFADTTNFDGCLLGIVTTLTTNGPPVRHATSVKDAALGQVILDLGQAADFRHRDVTPSQGFVTKFRADVLAYRSAAASLNAARKSHPYPKAPLKGCQFALPKAAPATPSPHGPKRSSSPPAPTSSPPTPVATRSARPKADRGSGPERHPTSPSTGSTRPAHPANPGTPSPNALCVLGHVCIPPLSPSGHHLRRTR